MWDNTLLRAAGSPTKASLALHAVLRTRCHNGAVEDRLAYAVFSADSKSLNNG